MVSVNPSSTDTKSQVLQATNLLDLVSRSVSLKRRGRNYVGLCPFHQEKTPSFNVDPTRGFFRCFGCGAKGNAIDFVMQRDRVEFLDALRQLAQAAGIELPKYGQTREKVSQRQLLLDANSAAGSFFEKNLTDPAGSAARDYLKQRGFTADSIRKFQIGLASDSWDALLQSSVGRKFPPPVLASAGLAKPRETGGFYDTFRNRLMFPIRDETGRIIAFGGRVMPGSDDPAKYLNSPETALFSKSRCVFGLDLAKQKIVETRTVAVVEGYTDVVMSHQFGATNVVSILGTAMTEQHISVLRRFADRMVLLFDADSAGENAMNRAVELFLTQPVEIAIANLPDGLDPDEYLLKYGLEKFQEILRTAADALTYKWKQLVRQFAQNDDLTGRQAAVSKYLDLLAAARGSGPVDSIRWGGTLARVSRLTEIPMPDLNRRFRFKPATARSQPKADPIPVIRPDKRRTAERWILATLLAEPHRWAVVQQTVQISDFTDETAQQLAQACWRCHQDDGPADFNQFLGTLDAPAPAALAVDLIDEFDSLEDPQARLDEALGLLTEMRNREEEQKHLAALRRTEQSSPSANLESDALWLLQEKRRQPDLRRNCG